MHKKKKKNTRNGRCVIFTLLDLLRTTLVGEKRTRHSQKMKHTHSHTGGGRRHHRMPTTAQKEESAHDDNNDHVVAPDGNSYDQRTDRHATCKVRLYANRTTQQQQPNIQSYTKNTSHTHNKKKTIHNDYSRWACSLKLEHAVSCVGLAAAMLTRYHLATEDKSTTPSTSSSSPEPRTPCSGGTAVDASSSSSCSPSSSSSPATSRANSPISPQPRKRSRSARAKARMAHLSDSVVAACLWLASKVEEVQCEVPSARDISESTGVEVKTLVSAELQVSVTLKWDLLKHWHNTTTQ